MLSTSLITDEPLRAVGQSLCSALWTQRCCVGRLDCEEPVQCSGRCDGVTAGVLWTHVSAYFSKISGAVINYNMQYTIFIYDVSFYSGAIRHLGEDASDKKEAFTPWLL